MRKESSRGFTVVELVIIMVVIGILAALVLVTYNGISQKDRDTERKKDIDTLYGQLESYQAQTQNSVYPTLANVNDSSWRNDNMKNLDPAVLQDPKGKSRALVAIPVANSYAYAPTPSKCDNAANGNCISYTLTATLEGGGNYIKQSFSQ